MKRNKINDWMMGMMSKLMLSCEAAGILICQQQHETLPLRKRVALKMHLMSCKLCERFSEDVNVVQSGIDNFKTSSEETCLHDHLNDKQKKSISQELNNQFHSN